MRRAAGTRGALLINLGTPSGPDEASVKAYLEEFLMDPYVIDIPFLFRWMLVHWAILPKRPKSSAALYRKIWTEKGSPLGFHHQELAEKVQKELGEGWVVKPAMRYGEPSIRSALLEFREQGLSDITVLPLYPQYSLAANESSIQEVYQRVREVFGFNLKVDLKWIQPFYDQDLFIDCFVKNIQESLKNYSYDHILFSFHGLPERHLRKTDLTHRHCFRSESCCDRIEPHGANQNCYRAQCFATARLIAKRLGLAADQYTVCFQSRLGRTPWIKPYTDELYKELPKRGIKRLAVVSPSFVADCLETLEEIAIRGREDFLRNGGEELRLVPSLNSSQRWASVVAVFCGES